MLLFTSWLERVRLYVTSATVQQRLQLWGVIVTVVPGVLLIICFGIWDTGRVGLPYSLQDLSWILIAFVCFLCCVIPLSWRIINKIEQHDQINVPTTYDGLASGQDQQFLMTQGPELTFDDQCNFALDDTIQGKSSENTNLYRLFVEHSLAGMYIIHNERFVYANPSLTAMLGYCEQELLDMDSVFSLIYSADCDAVAQHVALPISEKFDKGKYSIRVVCKDGSVRHVEVYSNKVGYGGQPAILGIMVDITERKLHEQRYRQAQQDLKKLVEQRTAELAATNRALLAEIADREKAEQDLRHKEEEFRALVENTPDVIERVDRNMVHVYINPAMMTVFGLNPNDCIGQHHQDILAMEDNNYSGSTTITRSVFETGKPVTYLFEGTVKGKRRSFQCRYVPEFNEHGKVAFVLCVTRDITELNLLQKEMARLDRLNLVGEMAIGIGHEVRNPMTTVRGFLQFLQTKPGCVEYDSYFQLMIEELDRANSIVTEFLSLAKNKAIHLEQTNLGEIVHVMMPLIVANAMSSGHTVEADLQPVADILADEKELRQLLLNLIRNSWEAMPNGGMVTIGTQMMNEEVTLWVKDQGMGIAPENRDKVGTPFFTTKEAGTGLGLAVCYSIAARHHAHITFDSDQQGTTFWIGFPSVSGTSKINH